MAEFPGFPGGGFDFGYAEAGAALAGLVVRDVSGNPRSGVFPSKANLITGRSDWNVDVAAFVVVRGDGRKVLIGGADDTVQAAITPAPASNSRIDVVYALARNVDAGDASGCVHVVTGVPGPIPVKPAVPAGGVELGTVTVPATATGTSSSTIANTFKQSCAAGGVVPFRDFADRDGFAAVDGQFGTVGDAMFQRSGGVWVPVTSGSVLLRPTGSSDTINTDGSVSFSAKSSVSLDGVFSSGFSAYDIVVEIDSAAADGDVSMTLRSGGSAAGGTTYASSGIESAVGVGPSRRESSSIANLGRFASNGALQVMTVSNPAETRRKFVTFQSFDASVYQRTGGAVVASSTACDGVQLGFSNPGGSVNVTGNIKVYGKR